MAHSNSYAKTNYTENARYGCICKPTTIMDDCPWCNAEEAEETPEQIALTPPHWLKNDGDL